MKLNYQPRLQYGDGTDYAALVAGTSQLASSAINAISVSQSSKKDRQFMQDMYKQQRADALADRDYANQYNSPTMEMQRLKAAGLNPNLIYGKAGGDMASAPVRSSSYVSYHRDAPQIGNAAQAVGTYFQVKAQQQQLENMTAQNALLNAQTDEVQSRADLNRKNLDLSGAKTANLIADTNLKTFQQDINESTRDIKIAMSQGQLDNLKAKTKFTLDENQRQAIMNDVNVQQALTHVIQMQAQTALTYADKAKAMAMIDNIQSNTELKDLDIEYIKKTGNTGRPGESPIAKLVEIIYGKLSQMGKSNDNPKQNLPQGTSPQGYIYPDVNQ